MLEYLVHFSIKNKLMVLLFTFTVMGFGIYSLLNIPIGAVPDITNNQVQVITTSRNLSTQDVEQFITYPVELEMANIPGVKEIRSVSKFGLSVVTIVFNDDMGTYLPRQLIAEKIKSASEKIPDGFGIPEMGPVTTGLGEIYQYVLDVDPEYKDKYSIMDIRTIQDWIVKRQLSGIPGVVEVNTWGGYLKQYEVYVNPEMLRSMNISVTQIYTALEKNNSIAGGGYIEKENESYFIRGEGLVNKIDDIRNIVITNRDGIPVYVKDVADVRFGHATRFGAITGNGEGEKVLGQVMMLKDANSKAVIESVKERVKEIEKTLPEGIHINAFLERSELIGKTTLTVIENLVLGCIIVIFVVVLLLGNLRSGMVVASVIPLSLLFALSLMYLFGVDANLMSLGAIDFGIIIDGAVIIVEYIAYQITSKKTELLGLEKEERQELTDKISYESTTKMMQSAIFGQLIIIIVFIPILSLTNVEGKMFKPMALTFCFALIGAMIFCFTYLPVIASMFLKPATHTKPNISDKFMNLLQKMYAPSITWALNHKKYVIAIAFALLIGTAGIFSTMGGEFVPTLDEGDFVIQPVLKTGTSLSRTVELTTRMEKILLKFPEVDQVVSRIGAAEVPTDPMSMEESDIIIKLKPKKEWTTAASKDELADAFKEALSEIPGIDYEFTQPIEMRFNELITGVRADLAIKVFGEDLDILYNKAIEIEKLIADVEGASDITIEKVAGLPQLSIKYDRSRIARYGLNIEDVNHIVSMAFAGMTAGNVFEGEKRFDLVIRFDDSFRKNIKNLENTFIPLPNGSQVPLRELAYISEIKGPAKISRDATKRRIVVGVNVRNRDLESVVKDVQRIIDQHLQLPTGYTISYGGQFENLRNARNRLMIAVPIALVLIFIMLHFAFKSIKDAFMVYTAIPLSSVGGILLLWLRDLPFSISAGVGFIALFGIAVLNGIVLIEHFKELKSKGISDMRELIILGTRQRLRPVLLTASAAALGFLPMAISTSAGAEVQRPLATVVIGGLVTATLLTLIVLPVLFCLFERGIKIPKITRTLLMLSTPLLIPFTTNAQNEITLDKAIETGLSNNAGIKASAFRVEQKKKLIPSAFQFDKTEVFYGYDENNIADNGEPLGIIGIRQGLPFPTIFGLHKKMNDQIYETQTFQYELDKKSLSLEIARSYYSIWYLQLVQKNYQYLDSIYQYFDHAAKRRFDLGETNYLEKLTAESKHNETMVMLTQGKENIRSAYSHFHALLQADSSYTIPNKPMEQLMPVPPDTVNHPGIAMYEHTYQGTTLNYRLEKSRLLPDLSFEYYSGSNNAENAQTYQGYEIGLAIPLLFGHQRSRINASKIEMNIINEEARAYRTQLISRYVQLNAELNKYKKALDNYNRSGQQLSKEIINTASKSFRNGEIDIFQYIMSLDNAKTIEMNYLTNLYQYNLTVLAINFLTI